MITVHKYQIDVVDSISVKTSRNARLLHVAKLNEVPFLWALVDTEEPLVSRRIFVCGTGREVPFGAIYVGTFHEDHFVWHVFDGGEL